MSWIRALAAAGLSVLFPGAGHALIRDWIRALLFAGLFVSAAVIFLPADQMSAAGSFSEVMTVVNEETSRMNQFFLSFVVLFAAVDSAMRAAGYPSGTSASTSGDGDDTASCPDCGKDLDEDLDFCHWCTARLDRAEEEDVSG